MTDVAVPEDGEESRHLARFREFDTEYLRTLRPGDLTPAAQRALARVFSERAAEPGAAVSTDQSTVAMDGTPVGVGGWLWYLIVCLLAGPLLVVMLEASEIHQAEYLHPGLSGLGRWRALVFLVYAVRAAQFALCAWAVHGLLRLRKPAAVMRAQLALWSGPVGSLLLTLLPGLILGVTARGDDMSLALFRAILPAGIWSMYLVASKRVHATYR